MSWVALERGARLAPLFGDTDFASQWAEHAYDVRQDVLANGLDSTKRHFVGSYGGKTVDAGLLLLPILRFIAPNDPRCIATIDEIRERLGSGPFLHRYKEHDGLQGREGAFVLCGFWLAEALATAGRIEEAQEIFGAHAEASNHLGLLAEEIDPDSGLQLGNFPQAFSHLGLINAAIAIDRALRMRDEGPAMRRGDP